MTGLQLYSRTVAVRQLYGHGRTRMQTRRHEGRVRTFPTLRSRPLLLAALGSGSDSDVLAVVVASNLLLVIER